MKSELMKHKFFASSNIYRPARHPVIHKERWRNMYKSIHFFIPETYWRLNMHLCVVVLVCTAVYGIGRISEHDLIAVNFAKAIPGQRLNESVIKEIEVESEDFCRRECVKEERCLSYNFGTTENNAERFKCELSDSDWFVGFINFTKEKKFQLHRIAGNFFIICLEAYFFIFFTWHLTSKTFGLIIFGR